MLGELTALVSSVILSDIYAIDVPQFRLKPRPVIDMSRTIRYSTNLSAFEIITPHCTPIFSVVIQALAMESQRARSVFDFIMSYDTNV